MTKIVKVFPNTGCSVVELVGHRVVEADGRCIGYVKELHAHRLTIGRRLWGIGPMVGFIEIDVDLIESIGPDGVVLTPTQSQYWQMPDRPKAG